MIKKKVILVMGMHRSGTSALTGVLNILGLYLGENIMKATKANEKGYFENNDIVALNDYLLKNKFNATWETNELIMNENPIDVGTLIRYVIYNSFLDKDVIGIKDPRMCLLLPFYQEVLFELGYEIHYVRTLRDQEEILNSLMNRDGFTKEKCTQLYDTYNYCLNKFLPESLVIPFSDLINKTDNVLNILEHNFPFLNYTNDNKEKIKQFIEPKLKHY